MRPRPRSSSRAASAALGATLRARGEIGEDAAFTIVQGEDMGRRSMIEVEVRAGDPRVRVSGTAVPIP